MTDESISPRANYTFGKALSHQDLRSKINQPGVVKINQQPQGTPVLVQGSSKPLPPVKKMSEPNLSHKIQGNPQEIKRHTGDGNNPISANKPPLPDRQEQGTPVLIRQTSNPQHPSPEGQSQLVRQPMQGNPQQGQQQFVRPVQVVRQGPQNTGNQVRGSPVQRQGVVPQGAAGQPQGAPRTRQVVMGQAQVRQVAVGSTRGPPPQGQVIFQKPPSGRIEVCQKPGLKSSLDGDELPSGNEEIIEEEMPAEQQQEPIEQQHIEDSNVFVDADRSIANEEILNEEPKQDHDDDTVYASSITGNLIEKQEDMIEEIQYDETNNTSSPPKKPNAPDSPITPTELPPLYMLQDFEPEPKKEKATKPSAVVSPRKRRYNSRGDPSMALKTKSDPILEPINLKIEYIPSKTSAFERIEHYESDAISKILFIPTSTESEKIASELGSSTVHYVELTTPIECAFNIRTEILENWKDPNSVVIIMVHREHVDALSYSVDRLLHQHPFKNPVYILTYEEDWEIKSSLQKCLVVSRDKECNCNNLGVLIIDNQTIYSSRNMDKSAPIGYVKQNKVTILYTELPVREKIPLSVTYDLFKEIRLLVLYGYGQNSSFASSILHHYDGVLIKDDESFYQKFLTTLIHPKVSSTLLLAHDIEPAEKMELEQRGYLIDGFEFLDDEFAKLELAFKIAALKVV